METVNQKSSQAQISLIREGFRVNRVILKNEQTEEIFWDSKAHFEWNMINKGEVMQISLPKEILTTEKIIRSVEFTSKQDLNKLSLIEKHFIGQNMVEKLEYEFGNVPGNTQQTWDQLIESADPEEMYPAMVLSGHLIDHICFYEEQIKIHEMHFQIFYS